MSARVARTDRLELVETHNLLLALQRLDEGFGAGQRWRRALYHALAMSSVTSPDRLKLLREALDLP